MYEEEILSGDSDDGTMPENVAELRGHVVGHRIVKVENVTQSSKWGFHGLGLVITLDNGKRVVLRNTDDCCAYTAIERFLFNVEDIEHVITGVGTTDQYDTWHIYADIGDILKLQVGWSSGNPFYYGYGFHITVEEVEEN